MITPRHAFFAAAVLMPLLFFAFEMPLFAAFLRLRFITMMPFLSMFFFFFSYAYFARDTLARRRVAASPDAAIIACRLLPPHYVIAAFRFRH